jgi:FkbM family methyltransferase
MSQLKKIFSDFRGLCAVCGIIVACRWLIAIAKRFNRCRREGNLQPADAALGDGPFAVRMGDARALLAGARAITNIREVWVRNVYLDRGYLAISPDASVVDLGGNIGAFTCLALAHGPNVRVVAIESDPAECARLRRNLELNGWQSRVQLINAFIGGSTQFQQEQLSTERCKDVSTISEEELLQRVGDRINFLKCDIEGSEFELFAGESKLLAATDQIAMESHPHAGDVQQMIDRLKSAGFALWTHADPPTITVLGRR